MFNLGSSGSLGDVLAGVAVEDVWGIGRQWAGKLRAQGIRTALALREADPQRMRSQYGVVMQRLILELRGMPCLGRDDIAPKKQIIVSRSFGERVTVLEPLLEAVSLYASRAGEKLRAQGSACGAMQVSLRTGKHHPKEVFYGRSTLVRFPVATSDTRQLTHAARRGLERVYKAGPRYAKAGVMLLDIVPADSVQSGLFARRDSEPSIALMQAMDALNVEPHLWERHRVPCQPGDTATVANEAGAGDQGVHDLLGRHSCGVLMPPRHPCHQRQRGLSSSDC